MKARYILSLSLLINAVLSSCGTDEPGHVDLDAIRTEAVSTFSSSLTGTSKPLPVASLTPTSLPTFTAIVETATSETSPTINPCYDLLWIEDRSIPDGTTLGANAVFTKTWLVQNNGGCAWAPGFTFNHFGGDPMRGKTIVLKDPIPVGLKQEISVELIVPGGITGLVQSSWRMADKDGNYFGDTLSVNILVGDASTPTPTSPP